MWRLSIDDDQSNRTVVSLTQQVYTLGRADDNAIQLPERNVSRHHARLERAGEHWTLTDLDSANGCFVNNQRIKEPHTLKGGASITLGDYRLLLMDPAYVPPEPPKTTLSPRSIKPKDMPNRLVVIAGPSVGAQFPLSSKPALIGRGEECDIVLNDTSVSRAHVSIEPLTEGIYQLRDRESSNGVRLNGKDVSDVVLSPGDVIELGDVHLQFVPKGHPFLPRPSMPAVSQKPGLAGVIQQLKNKPWFLLSVVAVGLLVGAGLFGIASKDAGKRTAEVMSPAAMTLERAKELRQTGNLEAAHTALQEIGPASNLRQSQTFREIEALWAEAQFKLAEQAETATEKRRILERIAETPGVDSLSRKHASDSLARLAQADLLPSDLPEAASQDSGAPPAMPTSKQTGEPVP